MNLHSRIQESTSVDGLTVHSYQMTKEGSVTVMLSFLAGDTFAPPSQPLLADVTSDLLDSGTKQTSKNALRERIEAYGAHVHFYARGNRVSGVLRCLEKDLKAILAIVIEQLTSASFTQKELDLVTEQMRSQCEEDKSETGLRAQQRLSALLYPKNHPNYLLSIEERLRSIRAIDRKSILEFYRTYYGRSGMHVVAVGDFVHDQVHSALAAAFKKLPLRSITPPARPAVPRTTGKTEIITIPDKMSVDVYLGHELPFTRDHADYYPFMLGIEVLGGGSFTSHLMQTVRVRDGLTYHIHAGLSGFGEHDQGNWYIRSQFAPTLFQQGMKTIHAELARFLDDVLTDARIEAKKGELIGSYAVSLGTTRGTASRMLRIVDEGKPLSEIDTYVDTINSIQPADVRRTMSAYMDLKRITTVAAGSIDKSGKPL